MDLLIDNLSRIPNVQNRSVLDVGIGSGLKSIRICDKFKNYYAIEPDTRMYNIAKKNVAKKNVILFNDNFENFIANTRYKISVYLFINSFHLIQDLSRIPKNSYLVILHPKPPFMDNKLNIGHPEFDESAYIRFKRILDNAEKRILTLNVIYSQDNRLFIVKY